MTDPFDAHPDCPKAEKKRNNILTLPQIREIIYKQVEKTMNLPPRPWGFVREDIVKALEKTLEELENICQNS